MKRTNRTPSVQSARYNLLFFCCSGRFKLLNELSFFICFTPFLTTCRRVQAFGAWRFKLRFIKLSAELIWGFKKKLTLSHYDVFEFNFLQNVSLKCLLLHNNTFFTDMLELLSLKTNYYFYYYAQWGGKPSRVSVLNIIFIKRCADMDPKEFVYCNKLFMQFV